MKTTNQFKEVIQGYILNQTLLSEPFKIKVESKKKNIDDCVTYILNEVKKSGCNGFADDEIFGMAMHYYDEENIDIGKKVNAKVVVNHVDSSDKAKAYNHNANEIKFINQNLKEEPNKEMQDNWKQDLKDLRSTPKKYWDAMPLESFSEDKERHDQIKFMQDFYTTKSYKINKINKNEITVIRGKIRELGDKKQIDILKSSIKIIETNPVKYWENINSERYKNDHLNKDQYKNDLYIINHYKSAPKTKPKSAPKKTASKPRKTVAKKIVKEPVLQPVKIDKNGQASLF